MKRVWMLLMMITTSTGILFAAHSDTLGLKEITLDNGLTVWLNEDHSQPKVFGAVVVNAGSKDCPDTGIAHYFEHMMFKGTEKIGTLDYRAEKILLDSISLKYDELARTKNDSSRKCIQSEINELSIRSSRYVIPNEFDRLISRFGGTGLNAWTSNDNTVYFNTFSPQYFSQWAELCSERVIDPVFRLFQSELETVYEEKNMYSDDLINNAIEKIMERFYAPHPYAYTVLGSTESLKNPQLSQMDRFFKEYYVAGNMGLIISGDFNTLEAIPVLEKTFGRIQSGVAPQKEVAQPKSLDGVETMDVLINIPLVNATGMAWRGVPAKDPDFLILTIALGLLKNENGTGSLDKLTSDRKILEAVVFADAMKEAGMIAAIGIPKIPFQSNEKARELILNEIDRLKKGDFSKETLESLKLEHKRNFETELESIDSRSQRLIALFGQGKKWGDYLDEVRTIESISKDDIVRVVNKYMNDKYLYMNKKTGSYPKDNLQKPAFEPIVPPHKDAKSAYALEMEKMPVNQLTPRFLDFEKDVCTTKLAPKATLYTTTNPLNDVFSLTINYGIGSDESRLINPASTLLNYYGTDSLSLDSFRCSLQQLGSTMNFSSSSDQFTVSVTGFDQQLEPTLKLVNHFFNRVIPDKKQLKNVVDARKIQQKSELEDPDMKATALYNKVRVGAMSEELNRLSLSEVKKLKATAILKEFRRVIQVACDIHYCGNTPTATVVRLACQYLSPETCTVASNNPVYPDLQPVSGPVVYFMEDKKASQSIIYGYIPGEATNDASSRHNATLFNNYFGGTMSSLMFQEIREFRSLAYRANAYYTMAPYICQDKPGYTRMMLSTQCDKTIDAMNLLDSLIRDMPMKPERVETSRFDMINAAYNRYPAFRGLSSEIARLRSRGYDCDPNKALAEAAVNMDINNINAFYIDYIKNRPVAWIVVGNSDQIDSAKLASFGKIVLVKPEEVFR